MRAAILCLLLALAAAPAPAVQPGEMLEDPAQEDRVRELGRELRCLVCANQSIFDSNAGLARDLRMLLRERIAEGDSDAEALAYISARYGDYVLLKPPVKAETLPLWIAPVAFLVVGLGLGAAYLHGRR
ncbi:MAG: cytochrome c-type biogenesis protein, partial [Pseudomonadota bacterium]